MTTMHTYRTEFSTPRTPERHWAQNHKVCVLTTSLERAIVLVMERHPDATVHAVRKISDEVLLVDSGESEKT